MKNVVKIGIICLMCFTVLGCKSKKNASVSTTSDKVPAVIVEEGFIVPKENDAFTISNAKIEGDFLLLDVSYSGGCETHQFQAFSGKNYLKSMPPQIGIFIKHNANGDNCRSVVTESLRFDLKTIKYPGKESDYTLILTLNNYEGKLTYAY